MPRLFTGLEIPPDATQALSLLRGGLAGARWIEPENYHLTLRFLGDVSPAQAEEAALALNEIRRAPLEIMLESLDVFGRDRPRSVIVRARASAELADLQAEHERLMRRCGLPPESRKFTPHVTLARLGPQSRRSLPEYLAARSFFTPCGFTAPRFVLYSSRDSVGGGPYVVEAAYDLR